MKERERKKREGNEEGRKKGKGERWQEKEMKRKE